MMLLERDIPTQKRKESSETKRQANRETDREIDSKRGMKGERVREREEGRKR